MLPFLSITGISLFIILLYFNVRKYSSAIYLGIFFLLVSLYCFHKYATLFSKSVFLVSIASVHIGFLFYLIGPMLYWYIRSLLTDNPRLKKKDFLHLLPMLVFFITSVPYIFTPYTEKVYIAKEIVNNINYLGTYNPTALYEILSPFIIFVSRPILILCYTFWSIILLIRFVSQRATSMVLSRQNFMTGWLSVLLGFTFVLSITQCLIILRTFEEKDYGLFYSLNLLQIISVAGLIGLVISPFFFPRILYGLPRFPDMNKTMTKPGEEHESKHEEIKKHIPNFESKYLQYIGQKADVCMTEFQPYLQPDFTVAQLSVLIHIPVHHLTYYFREVKKQSFHDYRNEWRITHAKSLLKKGKATEVTLETIGQMSGFSNRNSFRITFERIEGISPHNYATKKQEEI